MSEAASTSAAVRLAALGLTPSDEELAVLEAIAPILIGGLQMLRAVELADDSFSGAFPPPPSNC